MNPHANIDHFDERILHAVYTLFVFPNIRPSLINRIKLLGEKRTPCNYYWLFQNITFSINRLILHPTNRKLFKEARYNYRQSCNQC